MSTGSGGTRRYSQSSGVRARASDVARGKSDTRGQKWFKSAHSRAASGASVRRHSTAASRRAGCRRLPAGATDERNSAGPRLTRGGTAVSFPQQLRSSRRGGGGLRRGRATRTGPRHSRRATGGPTGQARARSPGRSPAPRVGSRKSALTPTSPARVINPRPIYPHQRIGKSENDTTESTTSLTLRASVHPDRPCPAAACRTRRILAKSQPGNQREHAHVAFGGLAEGVDDEPIDQEEVGAARRHLRQADEAPHHPVVDGGESLVRAAARDAAGGRPTPPARRRATGPASAR